MGSRSGAESQRLLNEAPLKGRTGQADPIFGDLFPDLIRLLLGPSPRSSEGIGNVYPKGNSRDDYPPTITPDYYKDRGQYYPPFDEDIDLIPYKPKGGYDYIPRFREVPEKYKTPSEQGGPA